MLQDGLMVLPKGKTSRQMFLRLRTWHTAARCMVVEAFKLLASPCLRARCASALCAAPCQVSEWDVQGEFQWLSAKLKREGKYRLELGLLSDLKSLYHKDIIAETYGVKHCGWVTNVVLLAMYLHENLAKGMPKGPFFDFLPEGANWASAQRCSFFAFLSAVTHSSSFDCNKLGFKL